MTDSVLWIWFQLMFGVGTRRSHALMEYFAHPGEIIAGIEKKTRVITMLRSEELLAWEKTMERAKEIQRRTQRKGCDIITPDHPSYPPLLQNIYAKPAALYVKGNLDCLRDTLVIAMVGTRNHSEYGKLASIMLSEGLAACGVTVVSGLAKGIDTFCHTAALDAGGKSIGVLGCGIDVAYPSGSAPLKRRLSENGAVMSEFPLGEEPLPRNFPMRNRIISGMSDGVIVVEADLKSGSMITAAHALDQNRELFAVPGSILEARGEGANRLIKDGAKLTEAAADVLEEFSMRTYPKLRRPANKTSGIGTAKKETSMHLAANTQMPPAPEPDAASKKGARQEPPEGVTDTAKTVYELIGENPVSFETIASSCELGVPEIQSALTELEIYGLIKGYPGRRFSL